MKKIIIEGIQTIRGTYVDGNTFLDSSGNPIDLQGYSKSSNNKNDKNGSDDIKGNDTNKGDDTNIGDGEDEYEDDGYDEDDEYDGYDEDDGKVTTNPDDDIDNQSDNGQTQSNKGTDSTLPQNNSSSQQTDSQGNKPTTSSQEQQDSNNNSNNDNDMPIQEPPKVIPIDPTKKYRDRKTGKIYKYDVSSSKFVEVE